MMRNVLMAIFPVSSKNASSLFDQKRSVFVKFTKFVKLERGSRIVFYVSKEKKLVGEGTIVKVENLDPENAWISYEEQLFLNETEYNRYVVRSPISGKDRKMKRITVFVLKNLRKYKNPIKSVFKVTPSGRYLTNEEYKKLKKGC